MSSTELIDLTADLKTETERWARATVDAITPSRAMTVVATPEDRRTKQTEDNLIIRARGGKGDVDLRVMPFAHQQFAERTGIPRKYYGRMLADQPALLAENINTWFQSEPENRLVRMLRPLTDEQKQRDVRMGVLFSIRALLSDRYRPLDNASLVEQLLPVLAEHGARVTQFKMDERYFHFRFATEELDILAQFVAQQPRLQGLKEIASFGGSIRNSETGHGALRLSPSVNIKRCTNVLIATAMYRQTHLGGRTEAEDNFIQADTRRVDDAATFMKVRDRVQEMFAPETHHKIINRVAIAAGEEMVLPDELPVMEFIDNVGRTMELQEGELSILRDEYVNEVRETGRSTRWSVAQALTATARRLGDAGEMDFARREATELAGWKFLEDPMSKFLRVVTPSAN